MQTYLLNKRNYTVVDCLEEVIDLHRYGSTKFNFPITNSYVPTKQNIMTRPDLMNNTEEDDLGMRYNMSRVSPHYYHNPLKGKLERCN